MWIKEDNTFNDIRKRSVEQWLESEIERLKDENNLKNPYLKNATGE